jgi:chromosome segregation ATPase
VKKIELSEEDYDKSKDDITGILQILNMLTQNINVSVESIKANIQQSNADAIETSAEDFKKFILDVIDIMKTVETVSCETEEMSNMLDSILQTLSLFTDNADFTINQIINKVKESADVAVQESTSNFDSFVMDLMEILENVHISLRKLTMSKSQELYKQLEEISKNIKGQEDDLIDIDKKLTEINIQKKHDSENYTISNKRFEDVEKRINEINEKIGKSNEEISERENIIKEKLNEQENLSAEMNKSKEYKENYWNALSNIQEEIDKTQNELENIQDKLQELHGIQNLYENIDEIEKTIENLNINNEKKKKQIILTEESINKVEVDLASLDQDIQNLVGDKEKFWGIIEKIQKEIDGENKRLEETRDKLRALDNIMRIINSIEELTKENVDANKNIEISNKDIDAYNSKVEEIQKRIDEVQNIIDSLREEKNKELSAQKEAQQNLNNLNKKLQKFQGNLNEIHKNKEREEKIISYSEEIRNTEKQIEMIVEEIEKIDSQLIEETNKKDGKQSEIDNLIREKDESWSKQKSYQKILTDLKSDLSMEHSKKNNFESKKIICTDQIETLYERSKDYGTLPPLTDDLSEEGLQSDIEIATKKKKSLEPVNLKAIEQYDVVKERFDEIDMRRQTIQRERKSILDAIDKIELEKTRTFMTAYHEINREFSRVFQKLSPGGSAKMILDRPDKPFEGGISIEARPRGKKISSLEILSGGEKTLVALSFIFAVQEFYPAPFYIMDEIDAALDGPNVHRVSTVIQEFSRQAQFLVISHREENIVNSDRIYGVSMQQSGITDIFSVDLEEEAKRLLELEDVAPKVEDN